MESVVKVLDNKEWVRETFQGCDFGDSRRGKRLLKVAESMINAPDESLPGQNADWADLKAAYRLFDTDKVTFKGISDPHWEQTRNTKAGCYLLISDTTDLNYTWHFATEGLGMLGDGKGRGIQLHASLMYDLNEKQLVGLAGAVTHYRKFKPKNESRTQRLARSRESDLWGELVEQIGVAPEGSQWIHVFDRGGDYFEAMCRIKLTRNDWVIRASQLNRRVLDSSGKQMKLSEALDALNGATELGTFTMRLRSTPGHAARTATLKLSYRTITFPAPVNQSPWLKRSDIKQLAMNVVIAREINAPKENQPICWVILTSLPIENFEDAWRVLEIYEHRWMIEEYNRVAKSGCSIEKHSLRTAGRLEALVGLTTIIAVRLFQLKLIGRNQPDAKAATHVPSTWLKCLKLMRPKIRLTDMTVYDFFRELAKLGGFLGRKHDGEPGWQTIWRGYQKLHQTAIGIELAQR